MIEFDSINSIIPAIEKYRSNAKEFQRLGDWGEIINEFDSFQDNRSNDRLHRIIKDEVLK